MMAKRDEARVLRIPGMRRILAPTVAAAFAVSLAAACAPVHMHAGAAASASSASPSASAADFASDPTGPATTPAQSDPGSAYPTAASPEHSVPASPGSPAAASSPATPGANAIAATSASVMNAVASPGGHVCGNTAVLTGPSSPPAGAVIVPAGSNSGVNLDMANTTYWFAPGVHTLGAGVYTQIDPGSGSRYIGGPGAIVDGQHINYFAFGGNSPNVTISYLTVQNFGTSGGNQDQGVVNHDSASDWTIDHTTITANAGAGVMLGSGNVLSSDCLEDNEQYGFNAYSPSGPSGLVLTGNEITGNDTYDYEAKYPGCGCSGGGKFWDVNGATVTGNWVTGNHSVGLWADTNNRGFQIRGNYIADNYANGIIYEISYNADIVDNTFVRNGIGAGPTNPGFPTGAVYISESGADTRVKSSPYPFVTPYTLLIGNNTFQDNWSGVVLWENADRFCNSPANTSSGDCTLVNPGVATLSTCNAANIAKQPYYNDCRWKTQNVLVWDNEFDFNPADLGSSCTAASGCGFQGLFSQYGTYPSWSPYQGTVVEQHITHDQDNWFVGNIYRGPWRFMAGEQGTTVTWSQWQSSNFGQDSGSILTS
jgi:hypothetical protein